MMMARLDNREVFWVMDEMRDVQHSDKYMRRADDLGGRGPHWPPPLSVESPSW